MSLPNLDSLTAEIGAICKAYVKNGDVTEKTPLISSGLLDSFAIFDLISMVEEKFGIRFNPEEMIMDCLDTPLLIATLVRQQLEAK